MIQLLTYSGNENAFLGNDVVINKIHDAESLDSFSINIVSLQSGYIWFYREDNTRSINNIDDLKSLSLMIKNSTHSRNIILLPQNEKFTYFTYRSDSKSWKGRELKNMIPDFKGILGQLYKPLLSIDIVYENTKTKMEYKELVSSFYFNGIENDVLSKSMGSNKATTIGCGNVILSTLSINNYDDLISFLRALGLIRDKQKRPEWMEEIGMFDDDKQIDIIRENQEMIQVAESNIINAKKVIEKNNEYKSILYTNSDELVKVVLEILEKMLGCDFSEFKDTKKEDFLTSIDGYTFIGEIKGVTHNVKSENVAQLDRHFQGYLDDNPDIDETKMCALLIINHQRNKPLFDREPVHER